MNAPIVCLSHFLSLVCSGRRILATKPIQFIAKGTADLMSAETSAPFSIIRCTHIQHYSSDRSVLLGRSPITKLQFMPQSHPEAHKRDSLGMTLIQVHQAHANVIISIQSMKSDQNEFGGKPSEILMTWTLDRQCQLFCFTNMRLLVYSECQQGHSHLEVHFSLLWSELCSEQVEV